MLVGVTMPKDFLNDSDLVRMTTRAINAACKAVHDSSAIEWIVFHVTYPAEDRYGNAEDADADSFEFQISELQKVNWSSLDPDRIFDLTDGHRAINRIARKSWRDWCAEYGRTEMPVCRAWGL
jgi:hypothetical protein